MWLPSPTETKQVSCCIGLKYTISQKCRHRTHGSNSVKPQPINFFRWQILWEICNKVIIKYPATSCICCHTTLWSYQVPEIAMFTKWVKQSNSNMKDSNCQIRSNHLKIVVEKVLPENVSIILLTDKNIFTVFILLNPQNGRLYASASSTSSASVKGNRIPYQRSLGGCSSHFRASAGVRLTEPVQYTRPTVTFPATQLERHLSRYQLHV